MSDKDHLFWRFKIDQGTQATYADPINSAFNAASKQPSYDGQGQWTHTFGSNATNQFIYAGSYYRAIFTQTPDANSVFPTQVYMAPLGYTDWAAAWRSSRKDATSPSTSSSTTSRGRRARTA